MKNKTCCFTGHRNIPNSSYKAIRKRLKKEIIALIKNGYCYFGTGGALGFDTIAAQVVLELKDYYKNIKLILVLPCIEQTKKWKESDIIIYEQIKNNADKYVYISGEYTKDCMHKRNRHLVDNSSCLVTYLTKDKGGTAYTIRYAKENNLVIINVTK